MDVGSTLRRARTRKGLTLEQLARATKISVSALDALETNDLDRLPATIYLRGFLRAYAREVGLDPQETVEDYLEQFEPPRFAAAAPAGEVDQRLTLDPAAPDTGKRRGLFSQPWPVFALGAAVAVVAIGSYFVASRNNPDAAGTEDAGEPTPSVAAPEPPPSSDAARAANVVADSLRVELRVTGPCWISASADRNEAVAGLLQAGDSRVVEANDEIAMRVGDPSTVSIVINGRPARSLGRAGEPVTVQITRGNFEGFLRQ